MAYFRPSYNPITCDDAVLNSCTMCKGEGILRCSHVQCQRQDWGCHRHLCKSISQFTEDQRPSQHHYRVIQFPTNDIKPAFAWMEFSDNGRGPTTSSTMTLLQANGGCIRELNDVNIGPPLRVGRGLRALMPGDGPYRPLGLRLNLSVLTLSKPGHIRVIYGPVVFCSFTREGKQPDCSWEGLQAHDATLRDLRAAIDFLLFQQADCISNIGRFHSLFGQQNSVWPAVKINCKADVTRYTALGYKPNEIESVLVPSVPIQKFRKRSCWASRLGLSWLWQRGSVMEDLNEESRSIRRASQNFDARLFVMDPDDSVLQEMFRCQLQSARTDGMFGVPPSLLEFDFGSIIVVHRKGAPIHPMHVSVFLEFVNNAMRLAPSLVHEKSQGGQLVQLIDVEILDAIMTKETFLTFWETLKSAARHDNLINQLPSPYVYEDD
ncbi:hypothetical protein F5X99DRAFT_411498 [Biscogniauxia marginata]|nr:hypothetical protein F5X99DRAFT_411498 [Biscogniauxia marginata]